MSELIETRLERREVFNGKLLHVFSDTVRLPDGRTSVREVLEHQGAVCVVPLKRDGTVVLVRQFRYAVGRDILEIPAGKIDKGETDPVAAAVRELREETGYTASEIIHLGDCNPSCAYSEEVIHLYLMRGLTKGERELDDDEVIELIEMPFDEVYEMGVRGEIVDSKTLAALLMTKGRL